MVDLDPLHGAVLAAYAVARETVVPAVRRWGPAIVRAVTGARAQDAGARLTEAQARETDARADATAAATWGALVAELRTGHAATAERARHLEGAVSRLDDAVLRLTAAEAECRAGRDVDRAELDRMRGQVAELVRRLGSLHARHTPPRGTAPVVDDLTTTPPAGLLPPAVPSPAPVPPTSETPSPWAAETADTPRPDTVPPGPRPSRPE